MKFQMYRIATVLLLFVVFTGSGATQSSIDCDMAVFTDTLTETLSIINNPAITDAERDKVLLQLSVFIQAERAACYGLEFTSGDYGAQPLIGPVALEDGMYRVTATTASAMKVKVDALSGACETQEGDNTLFSFNAGDASKGAGHLLTASGGCALFLTVSGTDPAMNWTISFEPIVAANESQPSADVKPIERNEGMVSFRRPDGGFVRGNPDAPVTIVVFADFLCPYCQRFKTTIDEFVQRYVVTGEANLEYRMYPVVDSDVSLFTAQLAECAEISRSGSFWSAFDQLYSLAGNDQFSESSGRQFAAEMGLDYEVLLTCTQSGNANQVAIDMALARSLEIMGVPSLRVRYGNGDIQPIPPDVAPSAGAVGMDVLAAIVASASK